MPALKGATARSGVPLAAACRDLPGIAGVSRRKFIRRQEKSRERLSLD
jgi:hypothetical protein